MIKKMVSMFVILVVSIGLVGAAGTNETSAEKEVTLRIASAFEQNTSMLRAAQRFSELVQQRSNGSIKVQIFPGGVMGGEKDNLESVEIGELEMGVFGTFPIVTLARDYSFFDAPFIFRDKDHYYAVWNGELGDEVRKIFTENHDIQVLGIMGRGYRHITSNKPLNSVDDLKGMKIRMGQSKPFIDAFTSIGAVVVPIALPELFTSLSQGVVSGSDGPFDQIYSYKLYEVQTHLALTGHLYATSMWLINDTFFNSLSKAQQEIITTAAKEALLFGDEQTAIDETKLLDELKAAGMQVTKPAYAPFQEKARPALVKLFSESWPVATWDEISAY